MKVLVADRFEKSGLDGLTAAGCEVLYEPDAKDDALAELIRSSGAEALVVRSTRVTRPMLESGRLSLVVRAGAGYNTIDVDTASERGISVANCPGKNSIAVAELAFGLILALDRRIPENVADLKRGVWNKKGDAVDVVSRPPQDREQGARRERVPDGRGDDLDRVEPHVRVAEEDGTGGDGAGDHEADDP